MASEKGDPPSLGVATSFMDVLDFWFAGDSETLYQTKWFPSDGSATQATVDDEVRDRFGPLLNQASFPCPHILKSLI